MKHEVKPAILR